MFTIPENWPTARPPYKTIVAQFGQERASLINEALNTGDPLADDLVREMHEIGMKKGRQQFQLAATKGLHAVSEPPPALAAFFQEVEQIANEADDYLVEEACLPFFTIPRYIHTISLSAGGLLRVYSAPSIAYVLTATGRLHVGAERRLVETSKWLYTATLPGSLRVGKQGYVDTLNVRLLHAHMRNVARNKGFNESEQGVAINQLDLVRTWIDFTYTSYTVSAMLGYQLTAIELEKLYYYWEHLGQLLGITEKLITGIKDHATAERIDELLQSVTMAPTDDSLALTNATLITIINALKDQTKLPPFLTKPLLHTVARRIQGNEIADQFQIPYSKFGEIILSRIKKITEKKRRNMRKSKSEWQQLIQSNIDANKQVRAESEEPTAYERGASRDED